MSKNPPIATSLEWGTFHVWKKDCWALQFYFPFIRIRRWELKIAADTVLRLDLRGRAVGIKILGFGLAFAHRYTYLWKKFSNDGRCYHDVSLKRQCKECTKLREERDSANA